MSTPLLSGTQTDQARLVVERKLPDDLTVSEFEAIVHAAGALCRGAAWASWREVASGPNLPLPNPVLARARYGSPLELVILVSGGIVAVLVGLTKAVNHMAASAKSSAEASKLTAEAEKIETETQMLRLQMQVMTSELQREEVKRQMRHITRTELLDAGALHAAQFVSEKPLIPLEFGDGQHVSELLSAIHTLARFDLSVRVERDS